MTDDEELSLRRESRFWELPPVKWWIRGHGRDGYSFRLLLWPAYRLDINVWTLFEW
ncbi:hypothetical protein BCO18175_05446 [Burkholderia contaminans]|uniref:hypothetical protein n=1 Tax=Burkholderia contaminans TaxID=488447 RepID=UPI001452CA1C|nr:hypothetical protein [Burkholderia contaminans]VWD20802.1 hypothetical protein BCO18175_05446 [Burkholderia contaminans]